MPSSCEVVNGKQRLQGGGGGGDGGGGAPLTATCRYVTKTVYVLGLDGQYRLEPRVVYECDGVAKPCPAKPDSPWRSRLQQGGGWRFHYAPVLKSLYRFTTDGTCGFYRGTRTTYPTGSLEYGETYPFAWSLDGNELTLQFVGGYVEKVQLLAYDAADDRIDRTVAGAAATAVLRLCIAQLPDLLPARGDLSAVGERVLRNPERRGPAA